MKVQHSHAQRSYHVRGAFQALVPIATFFTGNVPLRTDGLCWPEMPDARTVRSQMPCCVAQPSIIASPGAIRPQPAVFADSFNTPQKWVPVALVVRPGATKFSSRVQTTLATVSTALPEPPPSTYLSNAHFLI